VTDFSSEPARGKVSPEANLVSVIIPCYNQAHFLGQAIESVLGQSYSNFEIIVVDDGSTDNTAEVARRNPSVRYVYQKNAGLSNARNAGLRHSRGEFLVFLDADDRLLPRAIETGVSCMREHPQCASISGHCRVINVEGMVLPSPRQRGLEHEHYLELLRGGTYIWCPATVLYRRQIFDFVHGFNPALNPVADYDLYMRIARDFAVYSHHEVVAEYRQHRSSMSRDVSTMQRAALAAHGAQWDFIKGNRQYRAAYEVGRSFWRNDYPLQKIVSRIREIVRECLPPDAIVSVATGGNSELLRLDGRRAWHFPQLETAGVGDLFAEGAEGSLTTDAWIEPGMTYEFSLYGEPESLKVLARILVRGVTDFAAAASNEAMGQRTEPKDGAFLTADPNPVPADERAGTTTISWSTRDGSVGRVYVSSVGVYAGREPINSDEARKCVETARTHGAQYLLLPAKSFYWLDHYKNFRTHMEACYPIVVHKEDTCIIFDLRRRHPAKTEFDEAQIDATHPASEA
jgi:glycosyltransferase involved in cell wall biosynthesis